MDDAESVDDAALRWERLGETVVFECPGFAVREDDVRLPDGTETTYHTVVEPGAVVVLPFTPDGDVVTVAEWRQAVGRVNRGLPAGSLEGEEDPATAARRELREETGHEAETVEVVGAVEPTNGVSDAVHHHVVARGCTPTADQDLDHNESIRAEVRDYDDLLAAAVDGDLRDGRAVFALLRHELTSR
jgi:ADP-ribose pyrophosphatase